MINKKILKNLKLIVLDLDGTLLDKYGKISTESIEKINQLKQMGVLFSFATGRLHNAIVEHASLSDVRIPLISLDGAMIKSHTDNRIIYKSYIKRKHVIKAINLAENSLLKIALCHDSSIYYTKSNSLISQLMENFEGSFKEVESYDDIIDTILEIAIAGDFKNEIKKIEEKFKFPFALGLRTSFYKTPDQDGVYFLEIRNKNNSKGLGVLKLAKYLKISIKNTAVVGDWYNDKSMFRTKALKIAVANAVEELKEMADYVTTKTNDEDGVSEFLSMVIEAKNN